MAQTFTDAERIARYQQHMQHQLVRMARLALDGLSDEEWRLMHRASLHGAGIGLRVSVGVDGAAATVLRVWPDGGEPDYISSLTIRPASAIGQPGTREASDGV